MHVRPRLELVTQLIAGNFPLETLRAELSTYPWDLNEPLVVLQRADVAGILRRFIAGELTAADVVLWAEALELRDDVGFPKGDDKALGRVIFVLANPEVNGQLSRDRAEALLVELDRPTA